MGPLGLEGAMTFPFRRALQITSAALLGCAVFLALHWRAERFPRPSAHRATTLPPAGQTHSKRSAPDQAPTPGTPGKLSIIRNPTEGPAWAVPFGAEFWRRHMVRSGTPVSAHGAAAGLSPFQLRDSIDRVTHAFAWTPSGGAAHAAGQNFLAHVDSSGLTFSPLRTPSSTTTLVRFQTRRISVGTREAYNAEPSASDWCVTGNTAQSLFDPTAGVVVHYEVRPGGVEVTWVLSRPVATQSELTIEAELTGARFRSSDAGNDLSTDNHDCPRMRVGPAFAVDQDGRSWQVAVALAENNLLVTVPASILAEAPFPLAVPPLITPEFPLDTATAGPSPCTRAAPVVTANESGYFVTWSHGKSDITDAAVYGARVDPMGALLDPFGILISAQAGEQTLCATAANK